MEFGAESLTRKVFKTTWRPSWLWFLLWLVVYSATSHHTLTFLSPQPTKHHICSFLCSSDTRSLTEALPAVYTELHSFLKIKRGSPKISAGFTLFSFQTFTILDSQAGEWKKVEIDAQSKNPKGKHWIYYSTFLYPKECGSDADSPVVSFRLFEILRFLYIAPPFWCSHLSLSTTIW